MCLITEQKEPFIAEEDIIVYKILKSSLRSMCEHFQYELGKLYTTQIQQTDHRAAPDWHARQQYNKIDARWWLKEASSLISYGPGFHSYQSIERAKMANWHSEPNLYECTIPKGSEYYKDNSGCLVSNQIIINKQVEE